MKPYEKYRPSGVEWIGDIPDGWEVKKLKYITKLNPICNTSNLEEDSIITYSPMECVKNGYLVKDSTEFYNANNSYNFFMNGDILLAKVTPCFENGNIAIAENLVNGVGFGSSELFILRCKDINNRYMFYYYQTTVFRQMAISTMYGAGGLKRISVGFMKDNKLAVPPLAIQSAIANYLDSGLYTIDSIIKTKEKLIDLLKEKRTSVIFHAVTKGLNPNAKMKPSGVEWIGDIPEEWKVKRLKYLFHIYNGATPKSDNEDFWNGEIVWVTPADYSIEMQYINNSRSKITMEGLMSCAARVVPIGSIIISNRAPIGLVAISNVPLCTNQGCKSLISKFTADSRYFYYFLSVQQQVLNALGKGTTFLELSSSQLGAFMLPLPNIKVQSNIADYLDRETAQIDAAIEKTKQSIEKLKEYRTALISACVTGKIDVREG